MCITRLWDTRWGLGGAHVPVLTTLVVFGDAPWLINWVTMFSCPIKAATWIGVSPDWQIKTEGERIRNSHLWSSGNWYDLTAQWKHSRKESSRFATKEKKKKKENNKKKSRNWTSLFDSRRSQTFYSQEDLTAQKQFHKHPPTHTHTHSPPTCPLPPPPL